MGLKFFNRSFKKVVLVGNTALIAPKSKIGLYFLPGEPFETIKSIVLGMGHEFVQDFEAFESGANRPSLLPDMAIMDEHHASILESHNRSRNFCQKCPSFLPMLVALWNPQLISLYIQKGFHDCIRLPFEKTEVESRIITFLALKNRAKQLFGKLESQKHLLSTALQKVDEAVVITSASGDIVYANDSFKDLTGHGTDELLKINLSNIIFNEDLPETASKDSVHGFIVNGNVRRGTLRLKRADGTCIEMDASITPFTDSSLKGLYYVYVLRDISEKRLIEARTIQAQKLEALGVLAGGIAHDFNNILTPIIGYAELLRTFPHKEGEFLEEVDQILKAATRAKELVGELLSFSRQQDEPKRLINPVPILKEALKLLRAAVPDNINIVQDIDQNTPKIFLSPVHLHQIIMNLVINAYQAIGDRQGRIEVTLENIEVDEFSARTHPGLKPGPHVRLSVSDNGPGIPASFLHRIFDPYFTTKEEGKGTGLGLSVVHNILKNANGMVTVYSEEGKGATFRCYFPALKAEGKVQIEEWSQTQPCSLGLRVMLVDDDEMNLVITNKMFNHLGCIVQAFTDPNEALNTFKKAPKGFDLVFTDQVMPKMNGTDLSKALRMIEKNIPIIISSGYIAALRKQALTEAGVNEVLSKPFTLLQLKDTLIRIMKK
ncbi:multi-sensor hybrid histidine kinase [Dissulfuribacter thermophilus]|uniref:histidine kinase n=1 Tax=Dissulfuribacter thermophilus TaxID=1156395 RepID=A0A1B9F6E3_9BACT|nr:ATP-binding protein [Dissulfuribacter thermophilus]OCC15486.1 multi-sensor hybrid histidine kinase [Dissulfuribacter thermophilus]